MKKCVCVCVRCTNVFIIHDLQHGEPGAEVLPIKPVDEVVGLLVDSILVRAHENI